MDYPTSPSPIDRPAKKQRRVSQDEEDQSKLETHAQLQTAQPSNPRSVIPSLAGTEKKKKNTSTAQRLVTLSALTAEFMKLLHYNDILAALTLKLLDLYFSLWECYVVKSAEKIRLEDEERQLLESSEWLASDSDILLQLCDELAMVLCDRKLAVQALCSAVFST